MAEEKETILKQIIGILEINKYEVGVKNDCITVIGKDMKRYLIGVKEIGSADGVVETEEDED